MRVGIELIEDIYVFTDGIPSDFIVVRAWITKGLHKTCLDYVLDVEDEILNERGCAKRKQKRGPHQKRFCARI